AGSPRDGCHRSSPAPDQSGTTRRQRPRPSRAKGTAADVPPPPFAGRVGRVAQRWLRIRVDLVAGRGETLRPAPGRVMLVPPTATFADLGLGVDLAFGRWDVTQRRSFRSGWHGRHERRDSRPGDLAP